MADNKDKTVELLRKKRAARRASADDSPSSATSSFAMVQEPSPRPLTTSSAVGSVLIGGGTGEEASKSGGDLLSILTDTDMPSTTPLGSSMSKGSAASALSSSKKSSLCFKLFHISESEFYSNKFCGGVISSSRKNNGLFCARIREDCNVQSHQKKSDSFRPNTIFLVMYKRDKATGRAGNERVIEPEICYLELKEKEFEHEKVKSIITFHNLRIENVDNGSQKTAIELFNSMVGEVTTVVEQIAIAKDIAISSEKMKAGEDEDDDDNMFSDEWGEDDEDDAGKIAMKFDFDTQKADVKKSGESVLSKLMAGDTETTYQFVVDLADQVLKQQHQIASLEQKEVLFAQKNDALTKEIETLKSLQARAVPSLVKSTKFKQFLISNTTKIVSTSTREIEERLGEVEMDILNNFEVDGDVSVLRNELKTVQTKLSAVMRRVKQQQREEVEPTHVAESGTPISRGFASSPVHTGVSPSSEGFELLKKDVDDLAAKLTLLEAQVGNGEFIQIGDLTFKSAIEMQVFVQNNIPSCSWECFVDIVALMDTLKGTTVDDQTHASTQHSALKTQYVSSRELTISNSFSHYTPLTLCSKSESSDTVQIASVGNSLGKIKSYEDWKGATSSSGFKRWLSAELTNHKKSIKGDITRTLYNEHGLPTMGASLALDYLQKSCECIGELFNWTETFYSDLMEHSNVPASDAWELVMKCWLQFFHELRKVRCECSGMSGANLQLNTDARRHVISQYLWTMGRAIKIQEEFKDFGFEEHPAIATVINYHLLKHSVATHQLDDVQSTFEKKFKDIEAKYSALNSWKSQASRQLQSLGKK